MKLVEKIDKYLELVRKRARGTGRTTVLAKLANDNNYLLRRASDALRTLQAVLDK